METGDTYVGSTWFAEQTLTLLGVFRPRGTGSCSQWPKSSPTWLKKTRLNRLDTKIFDNSLFFFAEEGIRSLVCILEKGKQKISGIRNHSKSIITVEQELGIESMIAFKNRLFRRLFRTRSLSQSGGPGTGKTTVINGDYRWATPFCSDLTP